MASELAMQFAAQAWQHPNVKGKEMDPDLAEAFAGLLDNWMFTADQANRNAKFYRDLLDKCAQALGPEAYTADDGTVREDPVRLKIPALVRGLVKKAAAEKGN